MIELFVAGCQFSCLQGNSNSQYTAIVALTILSQNEISQKSFWQQLLEQWDDRKSDLAIKGESKYIVSDMGEYMNDDLLVLVAYLVYEFPTIQGLPHSSLMLRAIRLLHPKVETKIDIYREIYAEVCNNQGNIHKRPLASIIAYFNQDSSETILGDIMLKDALHSCKRLEFLVNRLDVRDFRSFEEYKGNEVLVSISAKIKDTREYIGDLTKKTKEDRSSFIAELYHKTNDLLDSMATLITSELFVGVCDRKCTRDEFVIRFEAEIDNLIDSILEWPKEAWEESLRDKEYNADRFGDSTGKPIFGKSKSQNIIASAPIKCCLYDYQVDLAVKNLFRNVVHSSRPILSPWNEPNPSKLADMWYKIDFHKDYILLTLVNGIASPRKTCSKNTDLHDVVIDYKIEENIIYCYVNIPIIRHR